MVMCDGCRNNRGTNCLWHSYVITGKVFGMFPSWITKINFPVRKVLVALLGCNELRVDGPWENYRWT